MAVLPIDWQARRWLVALSLVAACSAPAGGPHDAAAPDLAVFTPPFCTDPADGGALADGPPPTFASMERIFAANCAVSGCHDGDPHADPVAQTMNLSAGHAYAAIVGVAATETCGGTRVVPGDAGASYLYHKLVDETPCKGGQMPQSEVGAFPLPHCATEVVRGWIAAGAPAK